MKTKRGEGFKRSVVSNVEKRSNKMRNKECLGFDNLKPINDIYLSRFSGRWHGGLTSGGYKWMGGEGLERLSIIIYS